MQNMIDVKFQLINDESRKVYGFLPQKAEPLSTGYDVFNAGPDVIFHQFEYRLIPLGFKAFIPSGWWLFLAPRSSTHAKRHMHTLYGTIDESYEGEWYFSAQHVPHNIETQKLHIKHGDAIAQIIVMPRYGMKIYQVSDEQYKDLCKNRNGERGAGGFGSTGA